MLAEKLLEKIKKKYGKSHGSVITAGYLIKTLEEIVREEKEEYVKGLNQKYGIEPRN